MINEEYEVTYRFRYCNEKYWRHESDIVTITVPNNTKGNNHYSARLQIETGLRGDRICEYKIVSVTYR